MRILRRQNARRAALLAVSIGVGALVTGSLACRKKEPPPAGDPGRCEYACSHATGLVTSHVAESAGVDVEKLEARGQAMMEACLRSCGEGSLDADCLVAAEDAPAVLRCAPETPAAPKAAEPKAAEPEPAQPEPAEPQAAEPAPAEPEPAEPAPVAPAPAEPEVTEP